MAGGKFVGKTNLFKAYYWAHRYFWRYHDGLLTRRERVVRMPNGPGIDDFQRLLVAMESDGLVRCDPGDGGYTPHVFHLERPVELSDAELDAITKAVLLIDGRSATSVSNESHARSRDWREGVNGQRLDPYFDEIDERTLRRMDRGLESVNNRMDDVFGADPR